MTAGGRGRRKTVTPNPKPDIAPFVQVRGGAMAASGHDCRKTGHRNFFAGAAECGMQAPVTRARGT
jgi:hypothetical protein